MRTRKAWMCLSVFAAAVAGNARCATLSYEGAPFKELVGNPDLKSTNRITASLTLSRMSVRQCTTVCEYLVFDEYLTGGWISDGVRTFDIKTALLKEASMNISYSGTARMERWKITLAFRGSFGGKPANFTYLLNGESPTDGGNTVFIEPVPSFSVPSIAAIARGNIWTINIREDELPAKPRTEPKAPPSSVADLHELDKAIEKLKQQIEAMRLPQARSPRNTRPLDQAASSVR